MKKTIIAVMACIILFSCVANANVSNGGVQVLSSVEGDDAPLNTFAISYIVVMVLVVCFLLFLILRDVVCWYFKINKIVYLLEELNNNIYDMRRNKNIECDENENE